MGAAYINSPDVDSHRFPARQSGHIPEDPPRIFILIYLTIYLELRKIAATVEPKLKWFARSGGFAVQQVFSHPETIEFKGVTDPHDSDVFGTHAPDGAGQ
jgi:hypothetical protein